MNSTLQPILTDLKQELTDLYSDRLSFSPIKFIADYFNPSARLAAKDCDR